MTSERIKIHNEGCEFEMLEINTKWEQWTIDSAGVGGDVVIECYSRQDGAFYLSLSQDELIQVVSFLQKQIKQIKQ
jgi:hypothetical protein